jgi:hypothetical protein
LTPASTSKPGKPGFQPSSYAVSDPVRCISAYTSLRTSLDYGTHPGMNEMRKITVEVSKDDLDAAQEYTGEGVTETVRAALKQLRSKRAQLRALELRGKVKFGVDLMALRRLED